MQVFSEKLKELRKSRHITQKQLGELIGTSERGIQNYEIGVRIPTCEILILIADYFGVSLDYLVGRTDNPEINKEAQPDETSVISDHERQIILAYQLQSKRGSQGVYNTVRKLAKEKGVTLKEITESCGFSPLYFVSWQRKSSMPKLENLQKIADCLHVPVDDLLREEPQSTETTASDLFPLSDHEKRLVSCYRSSTNMQGAVDKILRIDNGKR